MKQKLILYFILIFTFSSAQTEKLEDYKIKNIENIILIFKHKNIDKISQSFNYPIQREYPIPIVKNQNDLKKRFNEIFDKKLIDEISNSKIDDWSEVGWRGIMLKNGIIWIDLDGKIIAVNYQSDFEKKLKAILIDKQKQNLFPTLRNFSKPIYKIQTKHFLIRIDEIKNEKYRYSSWKIGQNEKTKPELILNDGKINFDGSGGNHSIIFENKNYKYEIYRNIIGAENTPEISLTIEKDGKLILSEDGKLILN